MNKDIATEAAIEIAKKFVPMPVPPEGRKTDIHEITIIIQAAIEKAIAQACENRPPTTGLFGMVQPIEYSQPPDDEKAHANEPAHKVLDRLGAPRGEGDEIYTVAQRILLVMKPSAQASKPFIPPPTGAQLAWQEVKTAQASEDLTTTKKEGENK